MRGPRKVRTKIGPWPFILFVALNVLVALLGRWIESSYERLWPSAPPAAPTHQAGGRSH
jgi:hypothetical protein